MNWLLVLGTGFNAMLHAELDAVFNAVFAVFHNCLVRNCLLGCLDDDSQCKS